MGGEKGYKRTAHRYLLLLLHIHLHTCLMTCHSPQPVSPTSTPLRQWFQSSSHHRTLGRLQKGPAGWEGLTSSPCPPAHQYSASPSCLKFIPPPTLCSPRWAVWGTRMGASSSVGEMTEPRVPRVKMVFLLRRDGFEKNREGAESRKTVRSQV